MDRTSWAGRRVLVTGHTGFKGAWLTLWLEALGAEVIGLALPPTSSDGAYARLGPWSGTSHTIDLRDRAGVHEAITAVDPHAVMHLAAEAIVRRGYRHPTETFATNVMGTIHLLEAVRACRNIAAVLVVTSDKVYADASRQPAQEDDRLGHPDPYSSSKACVELVTATWRESFLRDAGIPVVTARAGNVIGGGDAAPDRLVPDVLRASDAGRELVIRSPRSIRPWQHVLDPLHGYLVAVAAMLADATSCPAAVNFGPSEPGWAVEDVVAFLHEELGAGTLRVEPDAGTREAPALLLDSSLAVGKLGWHPTLGTPDALRWSAAWHLAQRVGTDMRTFSLAQLEEFERRSGIAR